MTELVLKIMKYELGHHYWHVSMKGTIYVLFLWFIKFATQISVCFLGLFVSSRGNCFCGWANCNDDWPLLQSGEFGIWFHLSWRTFIMLCCLWAFCDKYQKIIVLLFCIEYKSIDKDVAMWLPYTRITVVGVLYSSIYDSHAFYYLYLFMCFHYAFWIYELDFVTCLFRRLDRILAFDFLA